MPADTVFLVHATRGRDYWKVEIGKCGIIFMEDDEWESFRAGMQPSSKVDWVITENDTRKDKQ